MYRSDFNRRILILKYPVYFLVRGGGLCLSSSGFNRRILILKYPVYFLVREGGLCLSSSGFNRRILSKNLIPFQPRPHFTRIQQTVRIDQLFKLQLFHINTFHPSIFQYISVRISNQCALLFMIANNFIEP